MIVSTQRTARTLAEWLTTDRLIGMDAQPLYVHEGLTYWLVGRRIITDSDYSLDIERFESAGAASARFESMATPYFENDAIIHDCRSGGYNLTCGDWGTDPETGRNSTYSSLSAVAQAYERIADRHGVYPGLWYDFSHGRGSGWALVDSEGAPVPESEHLRYV